MKPRTAIALFTTCLSLSLLTTTSLRSSPDEDSSPRAIPEGFASLEYLTGRWKGQGVPKNDPANSFRGWTETHSWSWVFKAGRPVALSLTAEGGRILASGKLTYDAAAKRYHLDGTLTSPAGSPIHLEGVLDNTAKRIVLESVGKLPHYAGTVRLSMGPNANFVRYTIREDRKESGGSQFRPFIEVGLTKKGESFASGATAAERAKCIITGAASTMSVTYQGANYPVCCTGCRDEFLDNPEKYIKKASLMLKAESGKRKSSRPATSRVARIDDAFANDVAEPEEKLDAKAKPWPTADSAAKSDGSITRTATAKAAGSAAPGTKKEPGTAASKGPAKAASLLQIGQNLEKNGGTVAALTYYRRIVKDYHDTPAAKTAAARIKAIGGRSD
jgi:YHS domain-containing protein